MKQFKLKTVPMLLCSSFIIMGMPCLGNASATATASPMPYTSVQQALDDLKQQAQQHPNETQHQIMQDGWQVIYQHLPQTKIVWSFSAPKDAAYPAVVRREITDAGQFSMSILCQASKSACEQLVATFNQMNQALLSNNATTVENPMRSEQQNNENNPKIIALTENYQQLLHQQQFKQAYALYSDTTQAIIPYADWHQQQIEIRKLTGQHIGKLHQQMTWYTAPPGETGQFVAVDYAQDYQQGQMCGYLIWKIETGQPDILVRVEDNFIAQATLKASSATELASLKNQLHCKL